MCVLVARGEALGAQTASLDLLRRATDPNPTLKSYTASAKLDATLHVVIPVHKSFDGTVYYLKPKRSIEFANVSGSLSKFKDLVTSTPSYEGAMKQYTVTPLTDDGSESSYSLVPKKPGSRVKGLILSVNDQSALIERVVWSYTNGGSLRFAQTYGAVSGFALPTKSDIAARFPDYSVDGTITFRELRSECTGITFRFHKPESVTTPAPPSKKVSLADIFMTFLIIGATSFGGGVVAYLRNALVTKKKWLDDNSFLELMSISNTLPGLNATNMSILAGDRVGGTIGSFLAMLGMCLPGFIFMTVAGILYGEERRSTTGNRGAQGRGRELPSG